MPQPQLRKKLEQLQHELASAQPGDPDAQARIEEVRRDVQGAIEQGAEVLADHKQSLLERLRNAIPYFESTHPRVTMAMAEVADELTRMSL